MGLEDLEFGTFREIGPNILEIIINKGVELDLAKIKKIEEGLLEKYKGPYSLLVNRMNSYSHTHESMEKVANLRNLAGIAILVYTDFARHAATVHKLYQDNVQVFDDREEAVTWVKNILNKSI
jgi:hypothetical protein